MIYTHVICIIIYSILFVHYTQENERGIFSINCNDKDHSDFRNDLCDLCKLAVSIS